jgi:hypothetical protein
VTSPHVAFRQAEVGDMRLAGPVHENVLRLQVAVDHARIVSDVQSLGDLRTQLGGFSDGRRVSLNPLVKTRPFDEVAGDVDLAVFPAHLMDGDDVRMTDLRSGAGFSQKLFRILAGHPVGPGNLNGHDAVQFRVAGFPDTAERTLSQTVLQLKVPERSLRGWIRGGFAVARQVEATAARRTLDVARRIVVDQFNRLMAVWAANVHEDSSRD